MIHEQEKLELLTQQTDIANSIIENKLFSREWVYNNIFELNNADKKRVSEEIIEDQKQKFRLEQIEQEGNDPVQSGEAMGTPHTLATIDPDNTDAQDVQFGGEWGGDRRSGTGEQNYGTEHGAKDIKDATSYERQRYGKREFKGGSPLYPGKGGTLVAKEGLLQQLKKRFGKGVQDKSILNENALLDEDSNE
jgi:hypothetical protein